MTNTPINAFDKDKFIKKTKIISYVCYILALYYSASTLYICYRASQTINIDTKYFLIITIIFGIIALIIDKCKENFIFKGNNNLIGGMILFFYVLFILTFLTIFIRETGGSIKSHYTPILLFSIPLIWICSDTSIKDILKDSLKFKKPWDILKHFKIYGLIYLTICVAIYLKYANIILRC